MATPFSLVDNSLSRATKDVCISQRKTVSIMLPCAAHMHLALNIVALALLLLFYPGCSLINTFRVVSDIHGHACDRSLDQHAAHRSPG